MAHTDTNDQTGDPSTLMFSMAFNGYDLLWASCIRSQRAYAERQGYQYRFVNRPRWTSLTRECAWLKIALVIAALKRGYDWVFFIDADAEVKPNTPPIQSLEEAGKSVYLVPGWSGRPNSGVLIVKNTAEALALFERMLANATEPVPEEDSVGWGENGHVIHFAKNQPFVKLCDRAWNNNSQPDMEDYVRHYSNGPMRDTYVPTWLGGALFQIEKILSRGYGRIARKTKRTLGVDRPFLDNLSALQKRCARRFAEFNPTRA
jgi:hypothetical protein